MQVFVNYPKTEKGKKELLNNLAKFKAELLLKSIDNLKVSDKVKDKVFEKVLEILDDKLNNYVI